MWRKSDRIFYGSKKAGFNEVGVNVILKWE